MNTKKLVVYFVCLLLTLSLVIAAYGPTNIPGTSTAASTSSTSSSGGGSSASAGGSCALGYALKDGICVKKEASVGAAGGEADLDEDAEQVEGETVPPEVTFAKEDSQVYPAEQSSLTKILLELSWLWIMIVVIAIAAYIGIHTYRKRRH